jgi:hypothetical protein
MIDPNVSYSAVRASRGKAVTMGGLNIVWLASRKNAVKVSYVRSGP